MIRDMETMLNSVCNEEIKLYLKEALNCYNVGAYRACIIMTMIGGIHDLHNKVKDLSPSNRDIADLELEINAMKNDLKPYERTLIEKCSTEKIDILNSNEAKELIRCFDTRNDCAHPSDYNCSAENARYVFTTIIDILASRPILLGQQYINNLVENINKDNFFPRLNSFEMQQIVYQYFDRFSKRIIKPLTNRLVKEILNDTSRINKNKQFFLANMASRLGNDFDSIVSPLIMDSNFNTVILDMIFANVKMVENLSIDNIKRLLCIIQEYTQSDIGLNDIIMDILQSKHLSDSKLDDNVADLINNGYGEMSDNQCKLWLELAWSSKISERRLNLIVKKYKEMVIKSPKFVSQSYLKILIKCNDQELNRAVVEKTMNNVAETNYNLSNPATNIFEQWDEEFISTLLNEDIEYIIYSILKGAAGYGREVKRVFDSIESIFAFRLFCDNIIPYFIINNIQTILNEHIPDYIIAQFILKVGLHVNDFENTFISLANTYISSVNKDEQNMYMDCIIITNVINSIQNIKNRSKNI